MSWESKVISDLRKLKDAGLSFEDAWRRAMQIHKPRGRVLGPDRPTLEDLESETQFEFLRRVSSDAWHGRRPELAPLRAGMEAFRPLFEEEGSFARPRGSKGVGQARKARRVIA